MGDLTFRTPTGNMAPLNGGFMTKLRADFSDLAEALAGMGALNLLTNPGFEQNQRVQSSYSGSGVYTLDRWLTAISGGGTFTVSPETGIVAERSGQSAKCVYSGAGSATLAQALELWSRFRGATVTFRARVRCATANAAKLALTDAGGRFAYSAAHTGSGQWETLSVTMAVGSDASMLAAQLALVASCTAYIDNATLVVGAVPLPYVPLHPEEDLRRCLRYYEVVGGSAGYPFLQGDTAAGAGESWEYSLPFKVTKGNLPTVTKLGTWTVSNCGQPTVVSGTQLGCTVLVTSTGAGKYSAVTNGADNKLVAEWNP